MIALIEPEATRHWELRSTLAIEIGSHVRPASPGLLGAFGDGGGARLAVARTEMRAGCS
jgi:hypothetical protein